MFSLQTIFGSGKQFYALLDEAAEIAHDSTRALCTMLKEGGSQPALNEFKLARTRERTIQEKISQELVDSFMTPIEREDIEALATALYKIPKQVEKFADRYWLAKPHLVGMGFLSRAVMLEQASAVVKEMVGNLRKMNLDRMSELNEKLRSIENEADRLMLEVYREVYSGDLDFHKMFLLKEFFEILERAIDRCREAGIVAYQIVLKNS